MVGDLPVNYSLSHMAEISRTKRKQNLGGDKIIPPHIIVQCTVQERTTSRYATEILVNNAEKLSQVWNIAADFACHQS